MKNIRLILSTTLFVILFACKKENLDDYIDPYNGVLPAKPVLIIPKNLESCPNVIDLGLDSSVDFEWGSTENTMEYILEISRPDGYKKTNSFPFNVNSATLNLEKGQNYSWKVIAINKELETSSEVWQFYLPGPAVENIAPFPASLVYPENNSNVDLINGFLEFKWEGVDLDNDELNFILKIETINGLGETHSEISNISENYFSIQLSVNTSYSWSIITSDGLVSVQSEVFNFKTN